MKSMKRTVSALLLCAMMLSCCCLLGGCMSKREKRIRDDMNVDGRVLSAVMGAIDRTYIDGTGFIVTEVDVTEEKSAANGGTTYVCDVTSENDYVAVTAPCEVTYTAEDVFAGVTVGHTHDWTYKALAGVKPELVGYEELPNHESVPYGECTVKSVKFSKGDQTCTVNVDVKADAGYVIASGELRIEFAFVEGKWAVSGYTYGKDFSMSWDIGGLWSGAEWKWNKTSTMNLRLEFNINSISNDGIIAATVYSHIRTGKKDQVKEFSATGGLDFATMTLTLDYENESGPCRITAKFVKGEEMNAWFEGEVIGTEDNFRYYKGRFTRE